MLAALVIAGVCLLVPPVPPPAAAATPATGSDREVVAPYSGICDTADVLDVLGDLKDDERRRDQIAVLQGRLIDCSRRIGEALAHRPAPAPTPYWIGTPGHAAPAPEPRAVCVDPPAPATMRSNRIAMYETLTQCVAYYTYLKELPTPAPVESPLPSIASQPTFYVFATGAVDETAAAVLIRSVVQQLVRAQARSVAPEHIAIVGRADWTEPASFAAQCEYDPNTRGALAIETSVPETERRNYFFFIADITNVSASVEMLGCSADDHNPAISPLSIWSDNDLTGKAHETALTTGILASLAGYFVTDRSSTSLVIGNGTATYSNNARSAPAFNGNTTGYLADQNLNLPAQNASTGLSVASRRFAQMTMERLHAVCAAPGVRELAAAAKPSPLPAPPEHRTLPYEAASLFIDDCANFAGFATAPEDLGSGRPRTPAPRAAGNP